MRAGTVGPFSIAPAPHRFPGTSAAPHNFSTLSPAADTARAARNIDRVSLQEAAKLNTLDLCQYQKIVVSAKALDAIIARVNGGKN